jgi:hypothetical protein
VIFHLNLSFLVDVEFEHVNFVRYLIFIVDSSRNDHKFVETTVTCHRIILKIAETYESLFLKLSITEPLALNFIIHAAVLIHIKFGRGFESECYSHRVPDRVIRKEIHD